MVNQRAVLATVDSLGSLLPVEVAMKTQCLITLKELMVMGLRYMEMLPAPKERVTMLASLATMASITTRIFES